MLQQGETLNHDFCKASSNLRRRNEEVVSDSTTTERLRNLTVAAFNRFRSGFQIFRFGFLGFFSMLFFIGMIFGVLFKVVIVGSKMLYIFMTASHFLGDLILRSPVVALKALLYVFKIVLFFGFWAGGFAAIRLYHDQEARRALETYLLDWIMGDDSTAGFYVSALRWVMRYAIRLGMERVADILYVLVGGRAVCILDNVEVCSRRLVDFVYFVLDSGCTNHVLTCSPLSGDTAVSDLKLGLAASAVASGKRYASAEIHVKEGENLLSLDRICDRSLGDRIALVVDRTTRLTPLDHAGGGGFKRA